MPTQPILACLLGLVLLAPAGMALAEDIPGPASAKPSVNDRMDSARRFIEARDYARAMTELQLVVKDDPQNADAHNLLGYSWRKRANPDVTKAFEHYYTALRINPRHKGAHEYIGQAYLLEKRPLQAEQHLAELEKICGGQACAEYRELAKAISEFKAKQ